MSEQHESYRIWGGTLDAILTQLNQAFNLIANRLDQLEGLRGTPTLYTSAVNYPTLSVSGFFKGTTTSADFSSVDITDLTGSTLILDTGYLQIVDDNGTTIHQLGDSS